MEQNRLPPNQRQIKIIKVNLPVRVTRVENIPKQPKITFVYGMREAQSRPNSKIAYTQSKFIKKNPSQIV